MHMKALALFACLGLSTQAVSGGCFEIEDSLPEEIKTAIKCSVPEDADAVSVDKLTGKGRIFVVVKYFVIKTTKFEQLTFDDRGTLVSEAELQAASQNSGDRATKESIINPDLQALLDAHSDEPAKVYKVAVFLRVSHDEPETPPEASDTSVRNGADRTFKNASEVGPDVEERMALERLRRTQARAQIRTEKMKARTLKVLNLLKTHDPAFMLPQVEVDYEYLRLSLTGPQIKKLAQVAADDIISIAIYEPMQDASLNDVMVDTSVNPVV